MTRQVNAVCDNVKFLSFISDKEQEKFCQSLGIEEAQVINGESYLENYNPASIPGKVLVLMDNEPQKVKRLLVPVIKLTKKRVAIIFFGGMPNLNLAQVIHFEHILEWPCQASVQELITAKELPVAEQIASIDPKPIEVMENLARLDVPYVIVGEEGTCKTQLARRLHKLSPRQHKPFVSVRAATLNDENFQQQLFGLASGIIRERNTTTRGLVQKAEGGTLFINDIAQLSLRNQFRLHRFMSDYHYRPLGSSSFFHANVRVVAGSDTDLEELLHRGRFRPDLMEKLSVFKLKTLPLRQRRKEIPKLVNQLFDRFSQHYDLHSDSLAQADIDWVLNHEWPGNIVELEQYIHQKVCQIAGKNRKENLQRGYDGIPILHEVVANQTGS